MFPEGANNTKHTKGKAETTRQPVTVLRKEL